MTSDSGNRHSLIHDFISSSLSWSSGSATSVVFVSLETTDVALLFRASYIAAFAFFIESQNDAKENASTFGFCFPLFQSAASRHHRTSRLLQVTQFESFAHVLQHHPPPQQVVVPRIRHTTCLLRLLVTSSGNPNKNCYRVLQQVRAHPCSCTGSGTCASRRRRRGRRVFCSSMMKTTTKR